jgi:hypothetical protein
MSSTYKITVPNTATHHTGEVHRAREGEMATIPPIWFVDGVGYASEGHPGIDKIRRYGSGHDGQLKITIEPVDAIPADYSHAVAAMGEHDLANRHGWPRGGPLASTRAS